MSAPQGARRKWIGNLLQRFWAAFERIIPRGVVALATISAAAVTDPHSLGLYSWAVLALTLYSAFSDLPIRHIAVAHIGSRVGEMFLRRYAIVAGTAGLVIMTTACWIIASLVQPGDVGGFMSLLPLALVPPAQALSTLPTAVLQLEGLWARVSAFRTGASLLGAGIGVPLVFVTRSVVGASIAVAASELAYALLVWLATRERPTPPHSSEVITDDRIGYWSAWANMSVYSVLGWLQGQSERGFLGLWAGTGALGAYSLGSAIGRSAGDAVAASQATVLRVDLSRTEAHSDDEIRMVVGRNLRAVVPIAAVSGLLTVLISKFTFERFLGSEWTSALSMVPILALTGIPLAVAASSAPVHIQRGKSHVAFLAPAICLLFAPVVGIAATTSLSLAAWTVLARECVLALMQSILMGRATPWREVGLAGLMVSVGAAAVFTF